MTKLVINKGAVIKQLSTGTAGVINTHDQHSSSSALESLWAPRALLRFKFHKAEIFLLLLSFFCDSQRL